MSVITEILDHLSGIEVVKAKLHDTGTRVERLGERVVEMHRGLHELDRRMVRVETMIEVAKARPEPSRKLHRDPPRKLPKGGA